MKPTFEDLNFIVVNYLAYGGSGEVFLIEEIGTKKRKILKRFLKEEEMLFAAENFIQKTIGQEASWHHIDNSTMISFEDTEAEDITGVYP